MGGNPINKYFSRKFLIFASLTLAFTISISDAAAANIEVLSKLEKWLFFATFADEPEEKRIARLEDKVFGEKGEGSLDDRLNKLDQVLSQRQKDKEDAAASSSAASSAGSAGGGGANPDFAGNTQPDSNNTGPPKPLSEDQIPDFPASGSDKSEGKGKGAKSSNSNAKGSKKVAQASAPKGMIPAPQAGSGGLQPYAGSGSAQGNYGSPGGNFSAASPNGYGGSQGGSYGANPAVPPQPVSRPQGSGGGAPTQGAPNYEAERQRIAVQAAREQEMQDLLQEGARLWRNRHGVEAVERFEQVLRLDPSNAEAHFSIGVIQESLGKYSEALAHYQSARKTNPDNKDYDDAVDAVLKRLQSQRNTPAPANKGLFDQATAAFKRGEFFSALDLFKQADAKTPNQPLVKYNIGSCYLMLKDHFNALENFKLAKELEPTNEKFNRAFNELSAEIKKNEAATQAVQQEYGGGAASTPLNAVGPQKQGKTKTASHGSAPGSSNQAPRSGQFNQQSMAPQGMPQQSMSQQGLSPPAMPQQGFSQQGGYPQQSYAQGTGGQSAYPSQGAGYGAGYPQAASSNPYSQNPYGNQGYGNSNAGYPGGMQQSNPYQQQQRPVYQQPQQQYPQMGMQGNQQQMGMQNSQYGSPMPNQQQFSQQQPVSSQDLATTYGLKVKAGNEGCQVVGLRSGSRAEQAGLQIGDVIRTADGNEVMQPSQLNQVLQQLNSMQRFPMLIFRNGNIQPIQF